MSAILEPKIWWERLYHLTREASFHHQDGSTYVERIRVCEDQGRRYEGEQDVYWPNVTCLECIAQEQQRLQRALDFIEFRAWLDEPVDLEVT